jgi:hypothetical protein
LFSFFLLFLVAVPRALAATAHAASTEQVQIVAHLPLNGMHVDQMFVQQRNDKSYLFLHRTGKNAFALVDVTKPSKPVLLSRSAMQEPSRAQVDPPAAGSVLAIAVRPEGNAQKTIATAPAAQTPATETVQLVDLSDPQNPKTLKTFQGVTSMYPDDARKLVYLVNDEGLWIIRHHALRPMPMCTSEEALNPLPDCQ